MPRAITAGLALVALFGAWAGCTQYSGPPGGAEFGTIDDLSQVAGEYRNHGDPDSYLSQIIWGWGAMPCGEGQIQHADIETIVVSTRADTVTLDAIRDSCVACTRVYVRGSDFSIENGRIVLREDAAALTRGGDDPLLGPSWEKAVIGLDTGGHALYRNRGYAAGLVFMVFPVAVSDVSEVRFERVQVPRHYPRCPQ